MQCYRFKRENAEGGKPFAFLYELGILLFIDKLFLITSDGELGRNRHDIYAQAYTTNNK
jgi:hypothetical protein